MSGFEQQTGAIQDRIDNPEVTPEQAVHPGFWGGGLDIGTPVQGIASGGLEVGQVLTQGIDAFLRRLPAKGSINPVGVGLSEEAAKPWERRVDEVTQPLADAARQGAKAFTPDPRLTGTAANVVFGASKVLTEAGALTALSGGNPVAGAGGLAAVQATARYQDYRDQGIDDSTALKLALVDGGAAGLGMAIPGGLPTSWLAKLTPARQLLTDLATGAAANTGQGAATRYVTHKILDDAGYHDLAEQSKVLDGEAMLTDMLTGGGFGALHFATNRKEIAQASRELARQDSIIADSARAAQNGQQIVERAPGVPVDVPSQAKNRASLEKATEDLLQDKPVDVAQEAQGATFARAAEDTRPMREVLHDEFKKAGVLDEWSKLEDLNDLMESRYEPPSVKPRESQETELPISETEAVPPEEGGYSVEEEALTDEQRQTFEGLRSHIPADENVGGSGKGVPGQQGRADDGGPREGAPLRVYRGSDRELIPEHFDEGSLGKASGHPSSGLGVFFTNDKDDAAHYGPIVTSHHLDIRNPKVFPFEDLPGFDTIDEATRFRDELKAQGHDGIIMDASHLGGPVQYVAFEPSQVKRADEPSDMALANAKTMADKVKDEAPKIFSAAADCATRTR